MKAKISEVLVTTRKLARRYSMVMTMAIIAAVSAATAIEADGRSGYFPILKLLITACLGISMMFTVKMLSQRIGLHRWMETGVLLFLTGFYFLLPAQEKDFTVMYAFILIPAFILSHLLVSFLPFFGENKSLRFWQYNKNLFINSFLTLVFTHVLVGGVMLAILAVDKLFEFNFNNTVYPQTYTLLAIAGSCLIFLLFCEEGLPALEADQNYPQILKFFTQYILIPLLLIDVIILYFYSAKILMAWELPRGWVSYLILIYSVTGILALLLVYPLEQTRTRSWVKIFRKVFFYTLAPLMILLFTAIFTRILAYGYTEPRYYVLLLAIWITVVLLYFIFARTATIKFIPVSLFAFGIFSLVFPYFTALSVSQRSQKDELMKVLQEHRLLENGTINFSKTVSSKIADEVSDKFSFLYQRKEEEFVKNLLNKESLEKFSREVNQSRYNNVRGAVTGLFSNILYENREGVNHTVYINKNMVVKTTGYDFTTILSARSMVSDSIIIPVNSDTITIRDLRAGKTPSWTIGVNGSETVDILPEIKKRFPVRHSREMEIPVSDLSTTVEFEKYRIRIVFESISGEGTDSGRYFLNNGFLLIDEK
ncbi:DUF4153 domain-containing protein [Chryseobacterium sp. MFBS3-17]|uniref:DUF4153 domain-containing protein n=1 Tax=Chryseobacterium sp. MFBS3-17 TaxID=2886689 RepID=UPI001D0F48AA|nr:DUF4153 domain-containing protein [Chryseobacterium sp. MFBS3-17]MCC2591668.1 DUF4153 domain-containing protein [Chryseobacterium sp. MFBS3-17]